MKTAFAILAAFAFAVPAYATPESRKVIAYDELMVIVPGLEELGYSRISTVEFCAEVNQVKDWTELTTDSEFEGMESCMKENT